jgi:hypothetical protein
MKPVTGGLILAGLMVAASLIGTGLLAAALQQDVVQRVNAFYSPITEAMVDPSGWPAAHRPPPDPAQLQTKKPIAPTTIPAKPQTEPSVSIAPPGLLQRRTNDVEPIGDHRGRPDHWCLDRIFAPSGPLSGQCHPRRA